MNEYLRQLIDQEQWEGALRYAEELTANLNCSINELLTNYCAILRARFELGDYGGAVSAGEAAMQLAFECEDWESCGLACNSLGAAHIMLKQYEGAVSCFEGFLTNINRAKPFPELHSNIWYNYALALKALNRGTEAIRALENALGQATLTGDPLRVHGITMTLVDACLKAGEIDQVPRLLAKSGRYLRSQPPEVTTERQLYHLAFRTEFALATGRLARARALAIKGLMLADGLPRHQSSFHLLLARVACELMTDSAALNHAWSARTLAVLCQRPDLEAEASAIIESCAQRDRAPQ